jgi:dimethylaniline monooxygenase (N-oxide forming) / hypotaurine monooxygenase
MGYTDWAFPEGEPIANCMISAQSLIFPPTRDAPLYPNAEWMLSFLESYAEHFKILPKIKFNTVVTAVDLDPASPLQVDGTRFIIKYKRQDDNSGNESAMTVDRLIVATGVSSQCNIPTIDGIEHFTGETLHSAHFRTCVIW